METLKLITQNRQISALTTMHNSSGTITRNYPFTRNIMVLSRFYQMYDKGVKKVPMKRNMVSGNFFLLIMCMKNLHRSWCLNDVSPLYSEVQCKKKNQITIIQKTYIIILRVNKQGLNIALSDIKTNRSFTAIFLLTKFHFDRNIQALYPNITDCSSSWREHADHRHIFHMQEKANPLFRVFFFNI